MADCCAELKAEIAALRIEVARLGSIDEERIVNKAVNKAINHLDPKITAVGIVAGSALGKALQALFQILGLLARLNALGLIIGTLVAAISLLGVLVSRVASLESWKALAETQISTLFSRVGKAQETAAKALGIAIDSRSVAEKAMDRANAAYDFANYAWERSNEAITKANEAAKEARIAQGQAISAYDKSLEAINLAETVRVALLKVVATINQYYQALQEVRAKAERALISSANALTRAGEVSAKADNAINRADAAYAQSEFARGRADAAIEDAVEAKGIAIIARLEAQGAAFQANSAIYQAQNAYTRAQVAYLLALGQQELIELAAANSGIALTNSNAALGGFLLAQAASAEAQRQAAIASNKVDELSQRFGGLTITGSSGITALQGEIVKIKQQQKSFAQSLANTGITAQQAAIAQTAQQKTLNEIETKVNGLNAGVSTNNVKQIANNLIDTALNPIETITNDLQKQINQEKIVNQQALAGIAGLGVLIGNLPLTLTNNKKFTDTLTSAAAAANCNTAKPGGCVGNRFKGLEDKIGQGINQGVQAGQGALLVAINNTVNLLNTKVGALIPNGGIAGQLLRNVTFAGVDRIMQLVTVVGVLHNCMMLSTSISSSFFSMLDNLFAIPTLIQNPNAETVDTKQAFTKYIDDLFADTFGATEWASVKAQWKAYSTIYSTASQVWGNVRDIFDETQSIQYTTNNWLAQLGNGLQDEGILGEENWNYKNDNQRPKGKYFARLERIREGLEAVQNVAEDLEQVTGSVKNIVTTANEIKENADTIKKAIDDANTAAKTDREAQVEGLEIPNFSLEDFF